jgi:hypothetical protein
MPVRVQGDEGVAEVQGGRGLGDVHAGFGPLAVQQVDGVLIGHGQGQFAATAGDLGGWFDILSGPEAELEPRINNEQGKGRRQLDRWPVQQAAVKVGAGGGAVDVNKAEGKCW